MDNAHLGSLSFCSLACEVCFYMNFRTPPPATGHTHTPNFSAIAKYNDFLSVLAYAAKFLISHCYARMIDGIWLTMFYNIANTAPLITL